MKQYEFNKIKIGDYVRIKMGHNKGRIGEIVFIEDNYICVRPLKNEAPFLDPQGYRHTVKLYTSTWTLFDPLNKEES